MADEVSELLKRVVGHEPGVSSAAVQARLTTRRRRRVATGALAALVMVLLGALLVWPAESPETVFVGDPTTTPEPPSTPSSTIVRELGADVRVACDFPEGPWFPANALEGPGGAESAAGVANDVLRAELDRQGSSGQYPASGWREVSRTDDLVVFVAPSDPADGGHSPYVSPYVSLEIGRFFDRWIVTGGGSCHPSIEPPDGLTLAEWRLDRRRVPSPADTELHLEVEAIFPCGQPVLTEDQVVGPDVTETEDAVLISLALDRPQQTGDESPPCAPGDPVLVPLRITVPLAEPLGDREVVDWGRYPALPAVVPEPTPAPEPVGPVVEFDEGLVVLPVQVVSNVTDETRCGDFSPTCSTGTAGTLTFTVDGRTKEVETDDHGWATAMVPDYTFVTLTAQVDGHWCSTTRLPTQFHEPGSHVSLGCTPLEPTTSVVSGHAQDVVETLPVLTFSQARTGSVAGAIAAEDGTYEVRLGPGTWTINLVSSFGGFTTCTPDAVTVVPGENQRLDLVCPYTEDEAEQILERLLEQEAD